MGGLKQITSTTLVCETLTNIYALPQILVNVVSQIPTGIYALSQSPQVARPVCVKIPAGTWYMSVQQMVPAQPQCSLWSITPCHV